MSITLLNCVRIPPLSLMRAGQEIDQAVACAAEVGRNLLGPLERRVHGVGPADRIVVEGHRSAEVIHVAPVSA